MLFMTVPWHCPPSACCVVQHIGCIDGLTVFERCGILHVDSPLLCVSVLCSNLIVPRGGGRRQYTGFLVWQQAENPFVMPVSGYFTGAILPARYYYSIKKRRGPPPHGVGALTMPPSGCPLRGSRAAIRARVPAGGYSVGFGPQKYLATGPARGAGPVAPRRQQRRGGVRWEALKEPPVPERCPMCGAGAV